MRDWTPPPLNAIIDVDAARAAGWSPLDLGDAFLRGGARFLQLRGKSLSAAALLEVAEALAERAAARGAVLLVNDRADVARLSGASGVHVGQTDLAPAMVRSIVGVDAIVGLSTHSPSQVARAVAEPVTYVAIGPIFATRTKATGHEAVGLEGVRMAAERVRAGGLRLVAIGGITIERAESVLEAGADAVAVIGDLLAGGDPERRTREFLERLGPPHFPRDID